MQNFDTCFDYNDHLQICLRKIEQYDIETMSISLNTLYREAKKSWKYMAYFVCSCISLSVKYKEHHYKEVADLFYAYKLKGLKLMKGCYFS